MPASVIAPVPSPGANVASYVTEAPVVVADVRAFLSAWEIKEVWPAEGAVVPVPMPIYDITADPVPVIRSAINSKPEVTTKLVVLSSYFRLPNSSKSWMFNLPVTFKLSIIFIS